mgnify:CR=1 FL=1
MIAGTVAELLNELGVAKSHSRPQVSNDNPYIEAHFKTLKYRPDYPARFNAISHARSPKAWKRSRSSSRRCRCWNSSIQKPRFLKGP